MTRALARKTDDFFTILSRRAGRAISKRNNGERSSDIENRPIEGARNGTRAPRVIIASPEGNFRIDLRILVRPHAVFHTASEYLYSYRDNSIMIF